MLFSPFLFLFFFLNVFHAILGWDQCHCQARLLPPILLAACAVSLRFCCSPFLLCGFLSVSRAAQSAVKSIVRAVAVCLGEQAGLPPPLALSHTHLLFLHPISFPRLNFFRLQTSPQQPFHYFFFFPFYLFFMHFPPTFLYSPSRRRVAVAAGGRWYSPAQALDFSF